MDEKYQINTRRSKWYQSYNKITFLLAGLCFLIPVGVAFTISLDIMVGGPFVLVGGILVILAILAYSIEIWENVSSIPFFCPYCDGRQRVKRKSAAYLCKKCGNQVVVRTAEEINAKLEGAENALTLKIRIPFAKIVLNYNKARKLEAQGRFHEALELYLDNIQTNKKVSINHYERAISILENEGHLEKALELAEAAIKIRYPQEDLREYANSVLSKKIRRLKEKMEKTGTHI
jgi:tetratricopeptide (TPR) repeat protein